MIRTTLTKKQLEELRMWLKLPSDEFSTYFDLLEEHDQFRVKALLETYRLDLLDNALELKIKL